jgi:hypothetical protein
MRYELMELSTGNMVGMFDSEDEALRVVADSIKRYGRDSVVTLALGRNDPDGDGEVIAQGRALADRALTPA